ncbi:CotO family spore coat protein [Ectobacillus antri]|jgi:hypothetical protein|uniref:CotO family spore coat protein n=1 Tax=Ectobacillus antri TaxID=2486280 RepID=A0ABT6H425_9BACI|nr:CotO family spore coat protein [Ectobacillus antri]MDG4656619.1 CotO family spore coat protein [Ectobacillus antri]MDG5754018.1 CotO family spore coat protein [Ectobacillus antri]
MEKKKNHRFEREPLLYISQPELHKPRAAMQQSFVIKASKEQDQPENALQQEEAIESVMEVEEQVEEQVEVDNVDPILQSAATEAVEIQSTVDEDTKNVIRKSFKDLDNKQKIHYVLNRPHYIPKILCEVNTTVKTHVGYITDFEDGVVTLKPYNQLTIVRIRYDEIINIQMRMF